MFATTTTLLVRWARGLIHLGGGASEQYVEMAGVQELRRGPRAGLELLAAHQAERSTTAVTGHVFTGAQQPGGAWYVGDQVAGRRVQSIVIGMDTEGEATITPSSATPPPTRCSPSNAGSPSPAPVPPPSGPARSPIAQPGTARSPTPRRSTPTSGRAPGRVRLMAVVWLSPMWTPVRPFALAWIKPPHPRPWRRGRHPPTR